MEPGPAALTNRQRHYVPAGKHAALHRRGLGIDRSDWKDAALTSHLAAQL